MYEWKQTKLQLNVIMWKWLLCSHLLPFQCPGRIGSFRTTTFSSDDLVPHFRGAATQPELAGPYKNKTPQNNTPVLVTSEISSVPWSQI